VVPSRGCDRGGAGREWDGRSSSCLARRAAPQIELGLCHCHFRVRAN
jgi:hypothetical protein